MEAAWCTCRSSVVAHCARAVVSKTVCWGSGWNNVLLEFLIGPINEAIIVLTWCCNSTKSCNLGTMATQWLGLGLG